MDAYTPKKRPIRYFLKDALAEDSVESDSVDKENLYETAYKRFCSAHGLAVLLYEIIVQL